MQKNARAPIVWSGLVHLFLASLLLAGLIGKDIRLISHLNLIIPIFVFAVCWTCAYIVIKSNLINIWTPLPWCLAACGLYFGLGPLAYSIGSERVISALDHFFPVGPLDLAKTNLLNSISIGLILIFFAFFSHLVERIRLPNRSRSVPIDIRKIITLFLAAGLPVEYLLALPYRFGLLKANLPGSVFLLEQLVSISLIPLTVLAFRGKRGWTWIWAIILASQLAMATFQFSKLAIMQILICLVLGILLRTKSIKSLVPIFGISASLLVFLTSLALTARTNLSGRSGSSSMGTISERIATSIELSKGGNDNYMELNTLELFGLRICYAPFQTFAVNSYDGGGRGETLKMGLYALVPRLLWPQKPVITSVGTQFNELLTGNPNSSSSPGIFAEFYWTGGWFGVIAGTAFIAILFSILKIYSQAVIKGGRWHLLPVVVLGLAIGYRIDGWAAGDYINLLPLLVAYHFMFILLGRGCRLMPKNGQPSGTPVSHS